MARKPKACIGLLIPYGAEQGFAGDGEQCPLVPRSRSSPRLKPSVRQLPKR
jgi:hypothetical protein